MIQILYVDDEPELLVLGKTFIERIGDFLVTPASGAPEALSLIENQMFDAIVSDYQMPDMDGIAFLKQLKSMGNATPFILFTGRGREEVVIEALNNGADFYLQKGGSPTIQYTELANKIRHAVSRKRAEQQVLNLQRRESDIINFLPDATFAIDTGHVVIAWNKAMEDLTGIPANEILGKGDYVYSLPFYRKKRPALLDYVLPHDLEVGEYYPSVHSVQTNLSTEVTIPDFQGQRSASFWINASPLYDVQGAVIGAIESIREITGQRDTQRLLLESERRFRITLDASNEGIWDWNIRTGCAYFSPQYFIMLGYDPNEMPASYDTWQSLLHPEDIIRTRERIQEHIDQKDDGYSIDFRMRTKSGEWKWILGRGKVIEWDTAGSPVRMVGTHTDITYLKSIEEKLKLDESRLETLLTLTHIKHLSLNEMTTYALGQAVRLTESSIGYVGFLSEDETVLTMHSWSESAMQECKITDKSLLYRVSETGLWGEPVRQRRPVITNDYPGSNYLKKGVPSGHVSLIRHLGVPISDDNKIVMIVGVGNKKFEYGQEDIRQLTLLMSGVWNIIKRKQVDEALLRSNEELSAAYEELSATEEELRSQYNLASETMELIRENEERFQTFFNSSLVGVAITAPNGRWLYFNNALFLMLGYSAEELKQMTWFDLIPAEDLDPEMNNVASILVGKESENIEKRCLRKDGSRIDVLISTGVERKSDGSIESLSSIILDITKRKQAEQSLHDSLEQQRILIENVLDPVIIVGFDGRVLFANPAAYRFFEVNNGEMGPSFNIEQFLTPDSWIEASADLVKIKNTGGPIISEYDIIASAGMKRTVEAAGHLIRWNGEEADLVSLRDITDRKEDKDALLQANRKLTILSSITRHDILNQVTGLLGYLDLLQDTVPDVSANGYIQKCIAFTRTIESQIAFTKMVDDIRIKSLSWQYAEQMVSHVLKGYQISPISCRIDLDSLYLFADPILEKVIFTLVENSIRHGEHAQNIRFSYSIHESTCVFLYEDDGSGIPVHEKEKIFRQGYGKHTGLGLFLIREILAINRMEIYETGVPGSGVRFEIWVPAGKWRVKGQI